MSIAFFYYKYQFIYNKNFYTVIPNYIYRSAQPDAHDLNNWKNLYNIKSILNLRGHEYINNDQKTIQTYNQAEQLGISTKFLAISSKKLPEPNEINEIIDFIKESPKPLLIHCKHGVDRTSMVSAIALILENKPIDVALNEMTSIKGFFPQRHQEILRIFLLEYKKWLLDNNFNSNKNKFMYWLNTIYSKSYYKDKYYMRKAFSYFSFSDWQDVYSNSSTNILTTID